MVDAKSVHAQLKRIKFNTNAWGRAEAKELPNILSPDEKIYECVNGIYDGGFAMLVATDIRVLLVDKKPLNYLTVEDLRFDMINQIDYNHRLMGASITINTGFKTLKFTSYNQTRLRKLINHVQDRMSELKKEESEHQENQKQHLAAINQQLQAYLLAQHQQLMQFQQQGQVSNEQATGQIQPIKPSPELADYLFAQSLMQQYGGKIEPAKENRQPASQQPVAAAATPATASDDLRDEGLREIFGNNAPASQQQPAAVPPATQDNPSAFSYYVHQAGSVASEVNPLRVLPMMVRNRKFGRPSFHAHSQSTPPPQAPQPAPQS